MSVYVDANILISALSLDALSSRAEASLRGLGERVIVSDFAGAEFASVIAKRVRMRDLSLNEGKQALAAFDDWVAGRAEPAETTPQDIAACAGYLRRLDLPLRTPEALHIALTSRLGATLLSLDKQMLASAKKLGVPCVRV